MNTTAHSHWTITGLGSWRIEGAACSIEITARPHYCDRGNFIATIDARGPLAMGFDDHEGWPRYFFDLERARAECEAWLIKRGQWVGGCGPLPQASSSEQDRTLLVFEDGAGHEIIQTPPRGLRPREAAMKIATLTGRPVRLVHFRGRIEQDIVTGDLHLLEQLVGAGEAA